MVDPPKAADQERALFARLPFRPIKERSASQLALNRFAGQTWRRAHRENSAQPEFGNLAQLRAWFSVPRSTAYELEKAGEIQFVRLRKRGYSRGRVLVSFDSVRRYFARCAESNTKPGGGLE